MAHFPRHHAPQWDLTRGESLTSKRRREATTNLHQRVDQDRAQSTGLWWQEQRYVDQVVPSEFVNPDHFDTFNYRYQVFARHPPIPHQPVALCDVTDDPLPIRYNVKRMAVDKCYVPRKWNCAAHWAERPWCTSQVLVECDKKKDCSKNNNTRSIRSVSRNGMQDKVLADKCIPQWPLRILPPLRNTLVDDGHIDAGVKDGGVCMGLSTDENCKNQQEERRCLVKNKISELNVRAADDACSKGSNPCKSCSSTASLSSRSVNSCKGVVDMNNNIANITHAQASSPRGNPRSEMAANKSCLDQKAFCTGQSRPDEATSKRSANDSVADLLHFENSCANKATSRPNSGHQIPRIKPSNNVSMTNHAGKDTVASLLRTCNSNSNNINEGMEGIQHGFIVDALFGKDIVIDELLSNSELLSGDFELLQSPVPELSTGQIQCQNLCLCQNNNASSDSKTVAHPKYQLECVTTPNDLMICRFQRPYPDMPRETPMSCMKCRKNEPELWRCRVAPRCDCHNPTPDEDDPLIVCEPEPRPRSPTPGYGTYKIIGGRQNVPAPPESPLSSLELPKHLEEYQEFIRRCPNYSIGRYDRSDGANEVILPGHRTWQALKIGLNPFVYVRNPVRNKISSHPAPEKTTGDLCWRLPLGARIGTD